LRATLLLFALAACGGSSQATQPTTPPAPAAPPAPTGPMIHFGGYEVAVPAGYGGNDQGQPSIINMLGKDKGAGEVDAVMVLIAAPRNIPPGEEACIGFAQGVPEGYMSEVMKKPVKVTVNDQRAITPRAGITGGCQVSATAAGDTNAGNNHIISTALRAPTGDIAILCFYQNDDAVAVAACEAVVTSVHATPK
jgi:hypothetical protein